MQNALVGLIQAKRLILFVLFCENVNTLKRIDLREKLSGNKMTKYSDHRVKTIWLNQEIMFVLIIVKISALEIQKVHIAFINNFFFLIYFIGHCDGVTTSCRRLQCRDIYGGKF